jgi:Helix-turn-helix domain
MSLPVIVWVMKHSGERLGRRLVLLALAEFAHDDGSRAYPSVETLCSRALLSERQVRTCLRELEAAGSIVHTGASPSGTHVYRVVMDGVEEGGEIRPRGRSTAESASDSAPDPKKDPGKESPTDARTIVAAYVDRSRAIGVEPPKRLVGHVAKEVGALLNEGQDPGAVDRAIGLLVDRRLHPSALPSLVPEAVAGPPRRRPVADTEGANRSGTVEAPTPLPPPPTEEERAAAAERLREMTEGIGKAVGDG